MRSRYSAYAAGEAAYILATTDPLGPHFERDEAAWLRSQISFFSKKKKPQKNLKKKGFGRITIVILVSSIHNGAELTLLFVPAQRQSYEFSERKKVKRTCWPVC